MAMSRAENAVGYNKGRNGSGKIQQRMQFDRRLGASAYKRRVQGDKLLCQGYVDALIAVFVCIRQGTAAANCAPEPQMVQHVRASARILLKTNANQTTVRQWFYISSVSQFIVEAGLYFSVKPFFTQPLICRAKSFNSAGRFLIAFVMFIPTTDL